MLRLQTNVGTSVVLAVLVSLAPRLDAAGPNSGLPLQRTEARQPCNNFVATKQPFFGETHLHTAYSFDAVSIDTRNTPKDAYRYAKGEVVGLPPWADTRTGTEPSPPDAPTLVTEHPYCMPGEHCEFMATRTIQLPEGRALDFAAITDHAEQFGESNICEFEATQTCGDDSDCPVAAGQKCISDMCRPEGYDSDTVRLGTGGSVPNSRGSDRKLHRRTRKRPRSGASSRFLRRRRIDLHEPGEARLGSDPTRRRGGIRPHRRVYLHLLRRLRVHGDGGERQVRDFEFAVHGRSAVLAGSKIARLDRRASSTFPAARVPTICIATSSSGTTMSSTSRSATSRDLSAVASTACVPTLRRAPRRRTPRSLPRQ